jgi:putative transposase
LCRDLGISSATFDRRRSKYSGMEASDLKPLNELEEENRQLKRVYADLSLNHKFLKGIVERKL